MSRQVHTLSGFLRMSVDLPANLLSGLGAPWGWAIALAVGLALVKVWPVIQLQAINAKATLRGEKRDDLHNCQTRLDKLEAIQRAGDERLHQLDMKLVGTVAAYRILHDDMSIHAPERAALHHARSVFQTTWDGPLAATASGELVRT